MAGAQASAVPLRAQLAPSPTPSTSSGPTASPTLIPTAMPLPTETPVPTAIPVPTIAVIADIESLFSKFSDEYHVDRETLKKVARCESSFNSQAENGPYTGMFQFLGQTWSTVRATMGLDTNPDLRKNAEEAIRTAAYMFAKGQANAWAGCL
jgi:soluble lytic murein transglycosylase-like protein